MLVFVPILVLLNLKVLQSWEDSHLFSSVHESLKHVMSVDIKSLKIWHNFGAKISQSLLL